MLPIICIALYRIWGTAAACCDMSRISSQRDVRCDWSVAKRLEVCIHTEGGRYYHTDRPTSVYSTIPSSGFICDSWYITIDSSGVVANIYLAERMASAEREPITGVWGQSPQRGPGAEPLVGVRGAKPPWSWKGLPLRFGHAMGTAKLPYKQGRRHGFESGGGTNSASGASRKFFFDPHFLASGGKILLR